MKKWRHRAVERLAPASAGSRRQGLGLDLALLLRTYMMFRGINQGQEFQDLSLLSNKDPPFTSQCPHHLVMSPDTSSVEDDTHAQWGQTSTSVIWLRGVAFYCRA